MDPHEEIRQRLRAGARLSFEEWGRCLPGVWTGGLPGVWTGGLPGVWAGGLPGGAEGEPISSMALVGLADRMRERLHPDGGVTYVVDRNVNYSNVCTSGCNFCAFYRKPGDREAYVLSYEEIFRKVEETLEVGGSGILMQGGLHPDLPLSWYTGLLYELKRRYPVHLHC